METVDIICLANSRKYSGRCIAGLRTDGKGWIRPVGMGRHGVLFERHFRLDDKTHTQVLDVVRIKVERPYPEQHQPENWLLSRSAWKLIERPASYKYKKLLRSHTVYTGKLFGNTGDKVACDHLKNNPAASSLELAVPQMFKWQIRLKDGRRKTRAKFILGDRDYNLAVTDPFWENELSHLPPGLHPFTSAGLNEFILTISLGEPFEGYCYKLVAAVIVLPRSWRGKI